MNYSPQKDGFLFLLGFTPLGGSLEKPPMLTSSMGFGWCGRENGTESNVWTSQSFNITVVVLFGSFPCPQMSTLVFTVRDGLVPKTLIGHWHHLKDQAGLSHHRMSPSLVTTGTLRPAPAAWALFCSFTPDSSQYSDGERQGTRAMLRFSRCPQDSPGQVRSSSQNFRLQEGWEHDFQTFCGSQCSNVKVYKSCSRRKEILDWESSFKVSCN